MELIGLNLDDPNVNPYDPKLLIKLVMAKDLFQQELPRMPKDYVTRLVFNHNHKLWLLFQENKSNIESNQSVNTQKSENISQVPMLVGGICFRTFLDVQLIEIAFCAVSQQQKFAGHGARLMNRLKEYAKSLGITDIVTYADDNAVSFFEKQGFSQKIYLEKDRWFGRIKHYEGAKFVHCPLYTNINYETLDMQLKELREILLKSINITPQPFQTDINSVSGIELAKRKGKLIMASEKQVNQCCLAAKQALFIELGKIQSLPFLQLQRHKIPYQDFNVDLTQLVAYADKKTFRTPLIFKELAKTIVERCENYNGEKAEFTKLAKQVYESLIENFEAIYEEIVRDGVQGIADFNNNF